MYINYLLLLLTARRLVDNNFSLIVFHRFFFSLSPLLVTLSAVGIFLYFTNEGDFLHYSIHLRVLLLFFYDDCLGGLNVQLARIFLGFFFFVLSPAERFRFLQINNFFICYLVPFSLDICVQASCQTLEIMRSSVSRSVRVFLSYNSTLRARAFNRFYP